MIRLTALLALLLPAVVSAQSIPNPARTGTGISGGPALSASDILNSFASKMDVDAIFTHLSSGQTVAQLKSGAIDAQPSIDAARASDGGVVLPCGVYSLQHPLAPLTTDGTALLGVSPGCVTLRVDFPTGDVITVGTVGASGLGPKHTKIGGFSVVTGVPHTSGAAINIGTHYDLDIGNIVIDGAWIDEVVIHGGSAGAITHLHNFWLGSIGAATSGACVRLMDYAVDTYISDGNMNSCGVGVQVDYASGIYMHAMDIFGSVNGGVVVSPASSLGQNVNALFADSVFSDTGANTGWFFSGTGPITDTHLINIWGSGNGAPTPSALISNTASGLTLSNANLDGFTLNGGHFHHNGANGIDISAGKNIFIGGGTQVWNNNVLGQSGASCGSSPYVGIGISGSATLVNIANVSSGNGGYMHAVSGLPNCQQHGLAVTNVAGTVTTISHSIFASNTGTNLSLATAAGVVLLDHNIGFVTKSSGLVSIASGQSCAAIAFGLDAGVADSAVRYTAVPVSTSGVSPYTFGATQFWTTAVSGGSGQVCGNGTLSAAVTFAWQASAYGD